MNKLNWFLHDRFGLFIHFGIYAIPARGEWVRNHESITVEDYQKYFDEFNPYKYDPKKWARAAKEAGMKYAVMTAKHHDGFCLFDSKLTDYKVTNTPYGKDIIKEYVEAFRSEGLKVGFYYSLLDWHHEDYPVKEDPFHPMRNKPEYFNDNKNFSRYISYFHGQVKELLTNYGKIDIIWFDFSYGDMSEEKWEASKLVKMVRELQPEIIINNRLGGDIFSENPKEYTGDFTTPEQNIPSQILKNKLGKDVPWEACITMNDNWGYNSFDKNYKTPKQLIRTLVECVSKGGNLLLNIGPNAKGEFPDESLETLKIIGKWMDKNSESIYGCSYSDLPKPEWGRFTQKGNKLYLHIFDKPVGAIALENMLDKVEKARLLSDYSEIKIAPPWYAPQGTNTLYINLPHSTLPDEIDTVIELTLK
ncbi:alpha-L-fucosidase [Caldicellulosiruptoraceae bacterium PP1]